MFLAALFSSMDKLSLNVKKTRLLIFKAKNKKIKQQGTLV